MQDAVLLSGISRNQGPAPQKVFGVGSSAIGMGRGAPYGIAGEAKTDPILRRLIDGLDAPHGIIGNFGHVQDAASGDEIDRLDYRLGTSKTLRPNSPVVTRMITCSCMKRLCTPWSNHTGSTSDKMTNNIVYYATAGGGAVFSVLSINWAGAMA